MSSILIKGMEMPKTCEACDFCHWSNIHQTGICDRCDDEPVCMDYGSDYRRGRASFCPLMEVPTPHGDLVDRNKLMTNVIDSDLDHLQRDDWKEVIQIVEDAPTIDIEPHWIPVKERVPEEERECWITPKTTSKIYRGIFTRHYGECHRTGFICDDGFMWLNTALAWMYCEVPEPYKGVTE